MPELQGILSGLIGGTAVVQTLILAYLTARCDWDEEVSILSSVLVVFSCPFQFFYLQKMDMHLSLEI
jgi:hypothetical protein